MTWDYCLSLEEEAPAEGQRRTGQGGEHGPILCYVFALKQDTSSDHIKGTEEAHLSAHCDSYYY